MDQQTNPDSVTNEQRIIELLEEQNKKLDIMLEDINNPIYEVVGQSGSTFHTRTEVIDINMSIRSMISFMFRWIIASIPVALVIGVVIGIFYLILGAALFR